MFDNLQDYTSPPPTMCMFVTQLMTDGKVLASCYIRMAEKHSFTHAHVDSFCDSTQWFGENICSRISEWIEATLCLSADSQHRKDTLHVYSRRVICWAEVKMQ